MTDLLADRTVLISADGGNILAVQADTTSAPHMRRAVAAALGIDGGTPWPH